MADEITMGGSLKVNKDTYSLTVKASGIKSTMTGTPVQDVVMSIGNTLTELDLGEAGAPGEYYIENLNTTSANTVTVGIVPASAMVSFNDLEANGGFGMGRWATSAVPYAIAPVSAVFMRVVTCVD